MNEAKEWSLNYKNYWFGIVRDNQGNWYIVVRYPVKRGEMNEFIPIKLPNCLCRDFNIINTESLNKEDVADKILSFIE